MFHTAAEFIDHYGCEASCTARVLAALTLESLSQAKVEEAWHAVYRRLL